MKICIYDKHFATLGGGEKHIGAVAEILSEKNQVFIFHCGSFKKTDLKKRLNLDLSKVSFLEFESIPTIDKTVTDIVKEFNTEIFINATYFSRLYVEGVRNMSLIFFPKYIYPYEFGKRDIIKYKIGNALFKEYKSKVEFQHFSNMEYIHGCFGRWSYARSYIVINSSFNNVKIYYENFKNQIIKRIIQYIKLHGEINFYFDEKKFYFNFNYKYLTPGVLEMGFKTFRPDELDSDSIDSRDLGLFITIVKIDTFSILTKLILNLWRAKYTKSILTRLFVKSDCIEEQLRYKNFLSKNEVVLSNSKYTGSWINKIYGNKMSIKMLYPPVSVEEFYSEKKENIILSVGRFFIGDHNKKQLELIKFFKRMYDLYPEIRSYTFHLCGGTHKEKRNLQYLELCHMSAEGYPIEIHPNIQYENLKSLYAKSKIFWHASGLYENEQASPDKFEHFGITTVEAMASGCIPVVIGVAGQLEIVENNINGFLWKTEEQLVNLTRKVIADETLQQKLSENAIKRAKDFDHAHFDKRVREIFGKSGVPV